MSFVNNENELDPFSANSQISSYARAFLSLQDGFETLFGITVYTEGMRTFPVVTPCAKFADAPPHPTPRAMPRTPDVFTARSAPRPLLPSQP